jgi:hypothetical protein
MAKIKMKVTYNDGREVEFLASPRAQVMTEERVAGSEGRSILAHYYLAWASLFKAGKEPADFETWLDLIAEAEQVDDEEPDPTQLDPSGDTSSGSAS